MALSGSSLVVVVLLASSRRWHLIRPPVSRQYNDVAHPHRNTLPVGYCRREGRKPRRRGEACRRRRRRHDHGRPVRQPTDHPHGRLSCCHRRHVENEDWGCTELPHLVLSRRGHAGQQEDRTVPSGDAVAVGVRGNGTVSRRSSSRRKTCEHKTSDWWCVR